MLMRSPEPQLGHVAGLVVITLSGGEGTDETRSTIARHLAAVDPPVRPFLSAPLDA
jgi:hypothetical protein